jgi:hypothetical protein
VIAADVSLALTPAQARALALLRRPPDPPPPVGDLAERLRAELEEELAPLADAVGRERPVKLSKHVLAGLHGCESSWWASRNDFRWSVQTARGTVTHKAIELSLHWRGEPVPGDLVDEAIARLVDAEHAVAPFLAGLPEGTRAELVAACVDLVAKFQECFPPLRPTFRPVCESRVTQPLCDERVLLTGVVDLTLGTPAGDRPGKVIVDFKTGNVTTTHREDLRFYALVETLRLGVPPRLVATLELDAGRVHHEEVTEGVLLAATRRVIDAAHRLAALVGGEEPARRPGPRCRWCAVASACEDGQAWLAAEEP